VDVSKDIIPRLFPHVHLIQLSRRWALPRPSPPYHHTTSPQRWNSQITSDEVVYFGSVLHMQDGVHACSVSKCVEGGGFTIAALLAASSAALSPLDCTQWHWDPSVRVSKSSVLRADIPADNLSSTFGTIHQRSPRSIISTITRIIPF